MFKKVKIRKGKSFANHLGGGGVCLGWARVESTHKTIAQNTRPCDCWGLTEYTKSICRVCISILGRKQSIFQCLHFPCSPVPVNAHTRTPRKYMDCNLASFLSCSKYNDNPYRADMKSASRVDDCPLVDTGKCAKIMINDSIQFPASELNLIRNRKLIF